MYRKIKAFLMEFDVLLFMAIIFLKVISLNYSLNLMQNADKTLVEGIMGSVFVAGALLLLFNGKSRYKAFIILDILISLLVLIDVVYNRYFMDVTSVALIYQAKITGEVKDSVKALLHLEDLKYIIDIIIFIPLYFILRNRIGVIKTSGWKKRFAMMMIFIAAGYTLSYSSVKALNRDQPDILKTMYDKKYVVSKIGGINFHIYDFYRYITDRVLNAEKLSDSDKRMIKEWFNNRNSVTAKNYSGMMKGKNLIVVQLEAFQGFVLNRSINGQEITPNLNKLSKESLVFDNYFYQTAWGGTSDAEFLSNVSLLPAREGSVYYQYAGNTYDSLISELKNQGYYTSVMHANRPGFWNRANMYKSLGFDSFVNENNYVKDDIQGLGLSDKSFFRQSVEKIKEYKQPFYTFMITLSSHFPYKDENNKIKDILNVGEFEGTTMGDYLKAVKYTDEAIGEFVDALKASGLWNNSVVVFYGDHSAIPFEKRDQLAKLLYNKEDLTPLEWFNAQKVVMMMHFPGEEFKGHNSMIAGQMDLYPTLANLFGVDAKYTLGRDLLNSNSGFSMVREGNWIHDNVVYLKSTDKVYDINTGKELNKNDYIKDFEQVYTYLKYSDAVIEHNLIKYFEGK